MRVKYETSFGFLIALIDSQFCHIQMLSFLQRPFILPFGDPSLKTWLSQPRLTFKTPTVMLFEIQRLNESSAIWRNWCLGFQKDVSLSVTHGLLVSKMSQAFCQKISQVCFLAGAPTLQLSLRHRGVLQDHLQEQVMSSLTVDLRWVFSCPEYWTAQ